MTPDDILTNRATSRLAHDDRRPASVPGGRALVVDDEPGIRLFCRGVLELMGLSVETCGSGLRAVELLTDEAFDLLLIDLRIPDLDGVEVLRHVRRRGIEIAIIVITGYGTIEDTAQTTLLGAHGILLKPFTLEELSDTVTEVYRKRHAERVTAQLATLHPLLNISQRLLAEFDLPSLTNQIVVTGREELGADTTALLLHDEETGMLRVAATAGAGAHLDGVTTRRIHEVATWVVREQKPLLLNPRGIVSDDADPAVHMPEEHTLLCTPMIVRGRTLGALYAERTLRNGPLTAADRDILMLLAGQGAVALENARLHALAHSHAERLSKLNALSTALAATLDVDQTLHLAADHLCTALPIARGMIVLCEGTPPHAVRLIPFGTEAPPARAGTSELQLDQGLVGQVLRDGRPRRVRARDHQAELSSWEKSWLHTPEQTFLCAALATDEAISGAIEIISPPGTIFDEKDLQFLVAVAAPVALALEKARLHASVARSEARYRALLGHAREAVLLLDHDGKHIIETNGAAQALSGYTAEELEALDPALLLGTDSLPQLRTVIAEGITECETSLTTRDGRRVPVAVGFSEVVHDGNRYVLLIARDISERKRMAQRLIQAEKLAGMGRLAAALAHEINNPLQAVQNSLYLLLNRPLDDHKRQTYLRMSQAEVERLVTIVQRTLEFYRPSRDAMRPVSLHEVLEGVLTLAAPQLEKSRITIHREWDGHLPRVMAIATHLRQVFLSLVLNAIDAMPNGGILTVRTSAGDDLESGRRRVRVDFCDTGSGIPDDEIEAIFEPFYTTRTERTGLGLSISYSIVEQHDGVLSVESTNKGATFSVVLPALA